MRISRAGRAFGGRGQLLRAVFLAFVALFVLSCVDDRGRPAPSDHEGAGIANGLPESTSGGIATTPNGNAAARPVPIKDPTAGMKTLAAPVLSPSSSTVTPGTQINFGSAPSTCDEPPCTYSFVANNSGATLDPATGVYSAGNLRGETDTIQVTDANPLGAESATATVTIATEVTLSPLNPATPVAPTGQITFTASGGIGPYTYSVFSGCGSTMTGNVYSAGTACGATGSVAPDVVQAKDTLDQTATSSVSVGPILEMTTPAPTSVYPRSTKTFAATGGAGGYTYTFQTNASGGTLNPTTGAYQAGTAHGLTTVVDTIQVTDALLVVATTNVTVGPNISISPAAPTPAPQTQVNFTANGGDTVNGYTWSMVTNPSGGSIDAATGVYTAGATPSTTDTVKVTDALGNTAEVNVSVGAGISINPATPSVAPKGAQTFTATGGTGMGYTWSLTSAPSGGSIGAATGAYIAGATGSVTDVVKVTDSAGNTASVNVTVTAGLSVTPPAPRSTPPRGPINFGVSGGSGTGYVWAFVTNNSGGTLNPTSGAYVAGNAGSVTDTIKVTDSLLNTINVDISVGAGVSVTPVPPPTPPRGTIDFDATGGSGTGYSFKFHTNASNGTVDATTGVYKAGTTPNVTDSIIATDSLGNEKKVDITVGAGVSISPATPSTPPLGMVPLSATGGSGTGYTWQVTSNNSGGNVAADGVFTAGPTGAVSDTVQVTDSLGNTASVSVSVGGGLSINPAAPSTTPQGTIPFGASGGSNTGYAWTIQTNNSGGSIGASNGIYKAGTTGNVTDVVRVTDSLGNTKTVNVTVGPAVTISPSAPSTPPLGIINFAASGGSGTGYTWSLFTNASGGSITAQGGYKAGTTGGVTDVVRATDSLGNTRNASVTVTGAVTISAGGSVPPKGSKSFTASGGAGGYLFSMQTNASGGTITASGNYTAGSTPNVVDVVRVTDQNGAVALTNVQVGAGVSISPVTPGAAPLATITFTATGGSGTGYSWLLITNNSGGAMNSSTGLYRAGAKGGVTDVVQATDSLGNVKTTTVSVGGVITIDPATITVPPKGAIAFGVTGGSGLGRTWAFQTNASGGTIDATTGAYVAGAKGSVMDVVRVTDSVGNVATSTITVGPGITVTPSTATVEPGAKLSLSVAGGSGKDYVWAIATNGSGGTIDQNGAYTAGSTRGVTDLISVTDSLGNVGNASVAIAPANVDGGTDDAGEIPYTGGTPVPAGEVGCGCRVAGQNDESASRVLGLSAGCALALSFLARRRKRRS